MDVTEVLRETIRTAGIHTLVWLAIFAEAVVLWCRMLDVMSDVRLRVWCRLLVGSGMVYLLACSRT